jgi:hypothetical protein
MNRGELFIRYNTSNEGRVIVAGSFQVDSDFEQILPGERIYRATIDDRGVISIDLGEYQYVARHTTGMALDSVLRRGRFGVSSTLDNESEKLLKEYEKAIVNREDEEKIARLRNKFRDRLGGRFIDSPIDELAIEIANEVRKDVQRAEPEQRQERIAVAAQLLRDRLREKGLSSESKIKCSI